MKLDVNTLFLVTIYVEAILGLLLLFAWVQNTAITAVAWWGFAHLLRAASVVLFGLYGSVPDLVSIDLANAILFTAFALTWTGARVFDHLRPRPILLFAGAALWLVVCRMPAVAASFNVRVLISSGIITAYTWAAAYEFWRGRSEPLVSRWPAIFMLFAHGSLYLLRTPFGAMLPWSPTSNEVFESVWLTVLSFEALLFTIAIAFILLAMAKERTEHRHKTARFDRSADRNRQPPRLPAGRRDAVEAPADRPASDRGHAARSRQFQIDQRPLRPRHGRPRAAAVRASRQPLHAAHGSVRPPRRRGIRRLACSIRRASGHSRLPKRSARPLPTRPREVEGRPVVATVSIGIVVSHDAVLDLSALLAQADHALYRAKDNGRNRIEIASIELVLDRIKRTAADRPAALGAKTAAQSAA